VILTNGNKWRLLDAQALRRYEAYMQVDLQQLVRDPSDLSALRVFYRCFHRSAFERNSEGESGLDRLLEASNHATKKAEDHLKACVSANEGVMAQLCLGLVESTGKDRFTEEERDAIYRDATYLLYRMLFILYAEARDLLPMGNAAYRRRSLSRLVETAHEHKMKGIPDPNATTLWDQLKQLCHAIYESDDELDIPAYNGGLFDDADKPYLREGTIADGHLTQALFDLAYQPDGNEDDGYRRIDYRDLSVRHLGSIYEGMIEYKLQIAEETLWARRDGKGNVRFLKTGQDGAPRRNDVEIKKGDVYFSQSPGERKATGTYYTPEFIVDYIVRQTVVRGLEERRAPLEERLKGWEEEVAAAIHSSERQRMQRTADEELLRFVEEQALTFRVCDPAMGSGHFLVNAAHHVTAFVVETLHLTPWAAHQIDVDTNAWRRSVVERCLYGVDISLMAVELAKLSLWLASVAKGKPLSFLDHHLRQGNSLIGVRLENLADALGQPVPSETSRRAQAAREAGQLSMLDYPEFRRHVVTATDLLVDISARLADTLDEVQAKEAAYESVRLELDPYRRLADVWIARHFDMEVTKQRFLGVHRHLVEDALDPMEASRLLVDQARKVAHARHFFHWELEFPEVFLGQREWTPASQAGFNAVIGNPPYANAIESETARPADELAFFAQHFESAKGAYDLHVLFQELSLGLTSTRGYTSMIVPNKFLATQYGAAIREVLAFEAELLEIADYSRIRVFEEASVYPVVYLARNADPSDTTAVRVAVYSRIDSPPVTSTTTIASLKKWVDTSWGVLIQPFGNLVDDPRFTDLNNLCEVSASATTAEAYELVPFIVELDHASEDQVPGSFRLITSGVTTQA
jgi:type I restriction-modification system DNA methylase subunit